ncbi:MAG: DsrE/DsrF/DrsH-like family protein [Endomicrobiales bacterium]|nr:DsrE/DsrF/DrsH-like family protein [Endomicrobiales bacterium]
MFSTYVLRAVPCGVDKVRKMREAAQQQDRRLSGLREIKMDQKEKMSIILFSGELDKAIAAFILATTAASSNMDVTIYFTFWGLNVLKKTKLSITRAQNILQKMFNVFSTSKLPISKLNMFGLGPWMMKRLMKKSKMASLEDLMKIAKQLNVKYIACTTSCGVMGLNKENLIEDVDEFAGAMTYIEEARKSKVNLFI